VPANAKDAEANNKFNAAMKIRNGEKMLVILVGPKAR
jgi:hypothetical protein